MSHSEFVHLHNHTEYSLLDGACALVDDKGKPSALINTVAKDFKMPALAITDHGNMYGAVEFYCACRESGIKPIIGCEVYVAPGSRFEKKAEKRGNWENYHHLTLLAKDFEGYQNLMQLVSLGFLEGFYYKPRVDKEIIRKYSKGIIALSGCLAGEVASNLLKEKFEEAKKTAVEYLDIFGKENFYLEIMDNGLEEQKKIIPHLMDLSKKLDIPLVATNDCHYLKKEDAYDHDVLLCIGTARTLDDPSRLKFSSDQFYYKSPNEMIKLFSYIPEATKNTLAIAEKTNIEIDFSRFHLPSYPVPAGETPKTYLEKLCRKGLKERYPEIGEVHERRLTYELGVINKMDFASYFLIVWDFICHAKQTNISVGPGRGSGAGSIVAYTLGITDICPLHYGLLFERFLNPDRRSMPDLDIDFADTGRDRVIEYVINKYGNKNCAQIITFGAMKARLVVRDVGRVMGFTPSETDRIAKLIPHMGATIYSALQSVPELAALAKSDKRIEKLLKTSQKLEGLKRHTGVHAAGMVIAKEEITRFSALSKGSKDIITTQYDGTILPKLGLLKVDFLGLKTLTVIDETIELVRKSKNKNFKIEDIKLDDAKTYELFREAKTLGVFQVESKGMRDLLRKLQPTTIEDIIALVALYRPGPMGSGMLDDFVSRKHGRTKVRYDHALLEPILKDTYGVILYQEQVMKIASELSGFSAGQADGLRKAMGKKIPEEIEKQRENFINGAKAKGIEKRLAEKIFEQIVHFGGYGFNKSHAAAYGIVSFRTAYLKANYPVEFMTALLNSEIGHSAIGKEEEESKFVTYLADAEKLKIAVLPPDIQKSKPKFSIEEENIRYGLSAIKNVGDGAAESIVRSFEKGPFKSWEDFIMRVDLHAANRKVLESLIKAGAFDGFGENYFYIRAELLAKLDRSLDLAGSQSRDSSVGQGSLFEMSEMSHTKINAPKFEALSEHDALAFEKEVLGFYLSGHPLTKHQNDLVAYSQYRLDRLPQGGLDPRSSPLIRVAGIVTNARKLVSKSKNELYARFKLEDLNGQIDVVVFPSGYKNGLAKYITPNNFVVVKGRLSGRDNGNELLAEEILSIEEAKQKFVPYSGTIRLKIMPAGLENEVLEKIKNVIKEFPGKSPVVLDVKIGASEEYSIETDLAVKYSDQFISEIEKIVGPDSLEMETQQQKQL